MTSLLSKPVLNHVRNRTFASACTGKVELQAVEIRIATSVSLDIGQAKLEGTSDMFERGIAAQLVAVRDYGIPVEPKTCRQTKSPQGFITCPYGLNDCSTTWAAIGMIEAVARS